MTTNINFGDAGSGCFNGEGNTAHEDKVIYHEYNHAVTYYLNKQISGFGDDEEGAISEGNADYLAGSYTNRSTINNWAAPQAIRDMANPEISSYSEYENQEPVEPHKGGEFWSAVLWDLRNSSGISASEVDWLVYASIAAVSGDPTFIEYRDAMMAEDQAEYSGAHAQIIHNVFANRGIRPYTE